MGSPREIVKDENRDLFKKMTFISRGKRPRERLLKFGADKLSDTELLAILLRVCSSGKSAVDMARELIKEFGTFRNIDAKSFAELKRKGLGVAKITQIKAAIEIGNSNYFSFFNEGLIKEE